MDILKPARQGLAISLSLAFTASQVYAAPMGAGKLQDLNLAVQKLGSSQPGQVPSLLKIPKTAPKNNRSVFSNKTAKPVLPPPQQHYTWIDQKPRFDIPVTYNKAVQRWVHYFQNPGRKWFRVWMERSAAYLPLMQETLAKNGMPEDLAYVAMIESGFSSRAISSASAVGYWQFIQTTANRYGLQTNWWLDERRDFRKSTVAAGKYLGDLYRWFDSWYLAAAAYNMGEGRMRRLITKYQTSNYWELSRKPDFPKETREYIPKLLAAMLIAKAPRLYGFHDLVPKKSYQYEYFHVPGGTDLGNLARYFGLPQNDLTSLNPELLKGFVPKNVSRHAIRIPPGYTQRASQFVRIVL